MLQKLMYGFIVLVFILFGVVFGEGYEMKAKEKLIEYQIEQIQETLNIHTKKLEILVGSQYELHSKIDQILK